MSNELNADLIWSLRALAQDAQTQRGLYPSFSVVADELVLDFDESYTKYSEEFRKQNTDLVALDAHTRDLVYEAVWADAILQKIEELD